MINLSQLVNRLIEGDVLDVLKTIPDNSIDLTVTSPPYNKRNKSNGWLVGRETYSHFDDKMGEDDYQAWQIEILDELLRVTKLGCSVFYNHKIRWEDGVMYHPISWIAKSKWHIRQEIVWDRGLAANMRGWRFWQVDERIYWLHKPKGTNLIGEELLSKHAKMSSVWRLRPASRNESHPAAFPIEIPARIIHSMFNSEGMMILDPFCGTGTTLVAAKLLGHSYLGIDISPDYLKYSNLRLNTAEQEQPLVDAEIAKHIIDDSFVDRKKRGTITWPFGPVKSEPLIDEAADV